MLLFFGENLDLETIEWDRLHEVALPEYRMGKPIKLVYMLLKQYGTRKIQRLTEFMQNRHPALRIEGPCERKLPHDLRQYLLM